ncbi:unnamed protein product, partial [Didymodactylos carnosus]
MLSTDTVINTEYAIQLFGNNSYLVLDKSSINDPLDVNEKSETKSEDKSLNVWTEYKIILDIKIPCLAVETKTTLDAADEKAGAVNETTGIRKESIITTDLNESFHTAYSGEFETILNTLTLLRISESRELCITNEGRLCVSDAKSVTTLKSHEYSRLVICKKHDNMKVYVNGKLELNVSVDEQAYALNEDYIYLFKELDNSNVLSSDIVRIECKSITFKNKCIDQLSSVLESPTHSLEKFVALPFATLSNSLMSIGYKKQWIKTIIKQYNVYNIQTIDTLIRQNMQHLLDVDLVKERESKVDLLCRLNSHIDREKLKKFTKPLKLDTDADVVTACEQILEHWNELQTENTSIINDVNNSMNKSDVDSNVLINNDDDNDDIDQSDTVEVLRPKWYSKCVDKLNI